MKNSVIHLSLNREKKIMGVDSNILTFEIILLSAVFILHIYYFLITIILMHMLFKWLMKDDGQIVIVSKLYSKEADFWDPWMNVYTHKININC
jgi:type IV secretory pathway VirB3-like protein